MPKCENCSNLQEQLDNVTEEFNEFKEMSQEYEDELEKNLLEQKKDVESAQYKALKLESENKELKEQIKVLNKDLQQKEKNYQDQLKKSEQKNKKNQKKLISLEIESEDLFEKLRRLEDEFQIVNQKKQYLEEQLTIYKVELSSIKTKYDYDVSKINQELQEAKEDLFIQQQNNKKKQQQKQNIFDLNCEPNTNLYDQCPNQQEQDQKRINHKKSLSMANSLVSKSKNHSRKRLQLKHVGLKNNQNLLNKIRFNLNFKKRQSQNGERLQSGQKKNLQNKKIAESARFIDNEFNTQFQKFKNNRQNTNIFQLIYNEI